MTESNEWKRWAHYVTPPNTKQPKGPWLTPYPWLTDIKIPSGIDTILEFGCANGRNLIPFDGKYRLVGVDIQPPENITWVKEFTDFKYTCSRMQDYCARCTLLSSTLVMTHCVMMYLKPDEQVKAYNDLLSAGCRNFLLDEYIHKTNDGYPFSLDRKQFTALDLNKNGKTLVFTRFEQ